MAKEVKFPGLEKHIEDVKKLTEEIKKLTEAFAKSAATKEEEMRAYKNSEVGLKTYIEVADKHRKNQDELGKIQDKITATEKKLEVVTSEAARTLAKKTLELQRQNAENKQWAKANNENASALEKLNSKMQESLSKAKNLGAEMKLLEYAGKKDSQTYLKLAADFEIASKESKKLQDDYREISKLSGDNKALVGSYADELKDHFGGLKKEFSDLASAMKSGNLPAIVNQATKSVVGFMTRSKQQLIDASNSTGTFANSVKTSFGSAKTSVSGYTTEIIGLKQHTAGFAERTAAFKAETAEMAAGAANAAGKTNLLGAAIGGTAGIVAGVAVGIGLAVKTIYDYNMEVKGTIALFKNLGLADAVRPQAVAVAKAFNLSAEQIANSLDQIMDLKLAKNEFEALEELKIGLLRAPDKNEFLSTIEQTSVTAKQLGINLKEQIAIIESAEKNGTNGTTIFGALQKDAQKLIETNPNLEKSLTKSLGSAFTGKLLNEVRSGQITITEGLSRIYDESEKLKISSQAQADIGKNLFGKAVVAAGGYEQVMKTVSEAQKEHNKELSEGEKLRLREIKQQEDLAKAKDKALNSSSFRSFVTQVKIGWAYIETKFWEFITLIREDLQPIFDTIGKLIDYSFIRPFKMLTAIFGKASGSINYFKMIWESMLIPLKAAFLILGTIIDVLVWLHEQAMKVAKSIYDFAMSFDFVKNMFSGAGGWFSTIIGHFKKLYTVITNFPEAYHALEAATKVFFKGLINVFKDNVSVIKDLIKAALTFDGKGIDEALDKLKSSAGTAAADAKKTFVDEFNKNVKEKNKEKGVEDVDVNKPTIGKGSMEGEKDNKDAEKKRKEAEDRAKKTIELTINSKKAELDVLMSSYKQEEHLMEENINFVQDISARKTAIAELERQKNLIGVKKGSLDAQLINQKSAEDFKKIEAEKNTAISKIKSDNAKFELEMYDANQKSILKGVTDLTDEIVKAENDRLKQVLDVHKKALQKELDIDEERLDAKIKNNEKLTANEAKYQMNRLKLEEQTAEAIKKNNEDLLKFKLSVIEKEEKRNVRFFNLKNKNSKTQKVYELKENKKSIEEKLKQEGLSADERTKLNDDLKANEIEMENFVNESKKELRQDYFDFAIGLLGEESQLGKALAIMNATMNTYEAASAILTTASKSPETILFPGYPQLQAGLIIASGMAQVAKINGMFWEGSDFVPYTGKAIVDELGAEIHTDRYGNIKSWGSDGGARITDVAIGDKIIPANPTALIKEYMFKNYRSLSEAGSGKSQVIDYDELRTIYDESASKIVSAIRKNRSSSTMNVTVQKNISDRVIFKGRKV